MAANGRPTKYKPKYCKMLVDHLASGLSYECFAGVCGVALRTLYEWEQQHVKFLQAKETGLPMGIKFLEEVGQKGMKGEAYINPSVWIFTMKNRAGWRDKKEVEHTGSMDNRNVEIDLYTEQELRDMKAIADKAKARQCLTSSK